MSDLSIDLIRKEILMRHVMKLTGTIKEISNEIQNDLKNIEANLENKISTIENASQVNKEILKVLEKNALKISKAKCYYEEEYSNWSKQVSFFCSTSRTSLNNNSQKTCITISSDESEDEAKPLVSENVDLTNETDSTDEEESKKITDSSSDNFFESTIEDDSTTDNVEFKTKKQIINNVNDFEHDENVEPEMEQDQQTTICKEEEPDNDYNNGYKKTLNLKNVDEFIILEKQNLHEKSTNTILHDNEKSNHDDDDDEEEDDDDDDDHDHDHDHPISKSLISNISVENSTNNFSMKECKVQLERIIVGASFSDSLKDHTPAENIKVQQKEIDINKLCNLDSIENKKRRNSQSMSRPKKPNTGKRVKVSSEMNHLDTEDDSCSSYSSHNSDSSDDRVVHNIDENKRNCSDNDCKNRLLESDESSDDMHVTSSSSDSDNEIKQKLKKRKKIVLSGSGSDSSDNSLIIQNRKKRKIERDELLAFKITEDVPSSTNNKKFDIDSNTENVRAIKKLNQNTSKDTSFSKSSKISTSNDTTINKRTLKDSSSSITSSDDDESSSDESSSSSSDSDSNSSSNSDESNNDDSPLELQKSTVVSSNGCLPNYESIENEVLTDTQLINDLPKNNNKWKKNYGRKNIRSLMDDSEIDEQSRLAEKAEDERLERLKNRKKSLKNLINSDNNENELDYREENLILDYDLEKRKPLLRVDKGIAQHLKYYQKKGVIFMWDSCFESIELTKSSPGSGCILAHCMGLGKTFQVVSLVYTLLTNKVTEIKRVLILCPLATVLNWVAEFDMWQKKAESQSRIRIFQAGESSQRKKILHKWHTEGGVLIMSYRKFFSSSKIKNNQLYLLDPGADLVVCDEGHILKEKKSQISNLVKRVNTKRRIVLTGTPLQNNLDEYHCIFDFVKPYLLGTEKEYKNLFVNPIKNGQYNNSTDADVRMMKIRTDVLDRKLIGCIQRYNYDETIKNILPKKIEYVIYLKLSKIQINLHKAYEKFIESTKPKFAEIRTNINRLLSHPKVLDLKAKQKQSEQGTKSSARLKDKTNQCDGESKDWWHNFITEEDVSNVFTSTKMVTFFSILEECEKVGDKVLVFSTCLSTHRVIEYFLSVFDTNRSKHDCPFKFKGRWLKNSDYFLIDGQVGEIERQKFMAKFNDSKNLQGRLMIVSTQVACLGVNLIGANRVIIFEPHYNPSADLQSIFRIFRYGQKKVSYIYRFVGVGTLEETVYNRQVTKLSLSNRVLDKKETKRHFNEEELDISVNVPLRLPSDSPEFPPPEDNVLRSILERLKDSIHCYTEHDSLLQHQENERLPDEVYDEAWDLHKKERKNSRKYKNLKKKNEIKSNVKVTKTLTPEASSSKVNSS
ncbi:hypothetical protein TKK_0018188 [Trichogramma kaykai]|uniref:ATRX n=1 Tax=Trichogramma kaykai TaxID=54128 RepID=A0ABD2W0S3_9HYME